MTPIFRWNGEYFGYLRNDRLFNAKSKYLGWATIDGHVWKADGTYLGDIENMNYILRRSTFVTLEGVSSSS